MTFKGAHPFVVGSACFVALGAIALMLVLLPSFVFADVPSTDATIDPAFIRAGAAHLPPLSHYELIVARPLFNAGRRTDPPPPPPAPPKPPPLPAIESYRLVGLVLSSSLRLALVSRAQGGDIVRLHPGDNLDGWTVEAVDVSGVQLTGQGNTQLMKVTRAQTSTTANAGLTKTDPPPQQSAAHP